ncbi:hypothetical protein [Chryseobacterium sp.]|uniref:hypothetical protein n=1 Tax=Chryseobacterium sp. TaxID=1871047 RepID=UPI0025BBC350|nr:hypothetical protein [Chryseobacterium sp.]
MKNVAFGILIIFFAFLGCRNDDDSIQRIDQILDIYMKDSLGRDLLNTNTEGAFTAISMNDVQGTTDTAPVSYSSLVASDSVNYIRYLAGARRITKDSISPDDRTYESIIALAITKKLTDSTTTVLNDTLRIEYHWSPSVFQVSKVYYNNDLKFTKEPNVSNVVTIVK